MQGIHAVDSEWSHKMSEQKPQTEWVQWDGTKVLETRVSDYPETVAKSMFLRKLAKSLLPLPVPHLTEYVYEEEDLHGGCKEKETRQQLSYTLVYAGIFFKIFEIGSPLKGILVQKCQYL